MAGSTEKYYLNITPADWTFSIWFFIYAGLVGLCIRLLYLGVDRVLDYCTRAGNVLSYSRLN